MHCGVYSALATCRPSISTGLPLDTLMTLKPLGNFYHIQTHYGSSEDFQILTGTDTTRMVPGVDAITLV